MLAKLKDFPLYDDDDNDDDDDNEFI